MVIGNRRFQSSLAGWFSKHTSTACFKIFKKLRLHGLIDISDVR